MREKWEPLLKTGFNNIADLVLELRQRRSDGVKVEPYDEDEVHGEHLGALELATIELSREEINAKGERLDYLRRLAIKHKKSIFRLSAIGGTTIVAIGSFWMLKPILDRDKDADITDKSLPPL